MRQNNIIVSASLMIGLLAGLSTEVRLTVCRLDPKVVPVFQAIELFIDTAKSDYSGAVVINFRNEPADSY